VCAVCEQAVGEDGRCDNHWCDRADRWWSVVWAVGVHIGPLRAAIVGYKYRYRIGWADVFGRLLLGYLDEHMPWFDDYDAIVSMPAYIGAGARRLWDPVARFAAVAERLSAGRWPVERGLVEKTVETPPMAGVGLGRRRARAEGALRRSLRVPDPARVKGARILVVDDVFTEGSTLREVARALVGAGATEVAGLALARQPWMGRRPDGTASAGQGPAEGVQSRHGTRVHRTMGAGPGSTGGSQA
jgi:predicted amidophosphoribosyltransferase